jgi:hypothetical protein
MKLTEHEMLVTLASMALNLDDLTSHDIIESLRDLGYGYVVVEARKKGARKVARRRAKAKFTGHRP